MSTLHPLQSRFPTRPLKFIAPLRAEKVDAVPSDGEYLGLEQLQSWTGRLSGVSLEQPPEGGANIFKAGDVLFGRLRPYLAKGWVADRAGFCTTEGLVLVPENADARFLRYCLLTPEVISAVDGSTYGSKMPRADWSFIGSVQIPNPPLAKQRRIANFLDEQTARIDALIAEKEALLQSLEHYWLCCLSYSMQVPAFSCNKPLPSSWRVTAVKRLCSAILTGRTPAGNRDDCFTDEGTPWVTPGDLSELYVSTSSRQVTDVAIQDDEVRVYPAGSTLLVGIGATVGNVAHAVVPLSSNQQINVLVPDTTRVVPIFLTLTILAAREQIRLAAGAATLPIINQDKTGRVQVALPPLAEQEIVCEHLLRIREHTNDLQRHVHAHIDRLREYRSSLISAAVTGKCRVNVLRAGA